MTQPDATGEHSTATGTVLACFHDDWEVALDGGEPARCSFRARHFANAPKDEKPVVPGDRVEVSLHSDGSRVIEEVLTRETVLSRRHPFRKRPVEQVIVANAQQLVAVASMRTPRLNRRMLDRYLVIAEEADLRSVVVFNKIDLVPEDEWRPVASAYERAGYDVVPTCATTGVGIDRLAPLLKERFSVFAGPSGAGKSSLLNAIDPGLGLKVREVSEKTSKGKHTTTNVTIFKLWDSALVADTPGFRELGLWRIHPDDLAHLFPEFRETSRDCRFSGCTHGPEPGCAVKAAVEAGDIDPERHESYLKLLEELRQAQ